jgi:hypothetical protein
MNVAEYIANIIEQQGRTKTWVAEQSDIKYKTFVDKLTFNRFTAEELLRIGKVLNIDLNKLKEDF